MRARNWRSSYPMKCDLCTNDGGAGIHYHAFIEDASGKKKHRWVTEARSRAVRVRLAMPSGSMGACVSDAAEDFSITEGRSMSSKKARGAKKVPAPRLVWTVGGEGSSLHETFGRSEAKGI